MGLGSDCYQNGNKTCYIPKFSKCYVETGLEMSFFICKGVFYRPPEHNTKGGSHSIELRRSLRKWNIPTCRGQKIDEKIWSICLVIIFTLGVLVIKMSKMTHCFVFSANDSKKSHSLGQITKCTWKILWVLSENCTVNKLWS